MREKILEAIGNIDSDLIEQVGLLRINPRKRVNFRLLTLIAASVCITVLVGITALNAIDKYYSDNMTANDEEDIADGGSQVQDDVKYAKIRITETDEYGFFGTVIESDSLIDGITVYVTGIDEIGFDMQNSITDTVTVSFTEMGSDEGDNDDCDSIQVYTIKAIRIEKGEQK